ncbi:MAG: hypothetical protein GY761_10335 [Hyphomicrobiales bacterium]|nr:hypothetical protein [Hyphomicrobiales bacterium]
MNSDETRKHRIARWKDKLKLSIDDDGNVLYGWGYPQSAHDNVLKSLNSNPKPIVDIDEALSFLDKEIGDDAKET